METANSKNLKLQDLLQDLPHEVLFLILSYLPYETLLVLQKTSPFWRHFIHNSPVFWRNLEYVTTAESADTKGVSPGKKTKVVEYLEKNTPELVYVDYDIHYLVKRRYETPEKLESVILFSLPRFLSFYDAVKREEGIQEATENSSVPETVESKYLDLEALPREILLLIISYLPCKTLVSMCSLSHFWRELICNSQTFRREFEFIKDGTVTEDSVVAYIAKNVPGFVRINAMNPLFWRIREEELPALEGSRVEYDEEIFLSLPRFLARYSAIKRDNISMRRFIDLCTKQTVEEEWKGERELDPISSELVWHNFSARFLYLCSPLSDIMFEDWSFREICTHIHLRLNTWDTTVWKCGSNKDKYNSRIAREILGGARMLSLPLDAMMSFLCSVVEDSRVQPSVEYLRFLVQPGSSVTIESKPLRYSDKFEGLRVLIINDAKQGDSCSPPPRHEISQNLLAQILQAMPDLRKLVLCDFHVSSDDGSGLEKQEVLDMRQCKRLLRVDFSGTKFACGFPLLSDRLYHSIKLCRSPHIANMLEAGSKGLCVFPRTLTLDLSGNSDITDAIMLNYFIHMYERGCLTGELALRNCPGLGFSSQLHEHLMHYHTIDLSRNKAVTDDVLSGLLQTADAARKRFSNPLATNVCRTSMTEQTYRRMMKQNKLVHAYWCGLEESRESLAEKRWEESISGFML
ncbi:hypothetical protein BZA70DRAFT_267186 [Myxozyma melibiosi]|uniref:F-box domain-containing protein n=1 Tax=Myxozyma melibiosi TaxID=54550 RepID=A0ABR1F669_9ASCO